MYVHWTKCKLPAKVRIGEHGMILAVHAVYEVGSLPSSTGDEVRSAGGSVGFPVIKIAPGEMAYIQKRTRFDIPDFVKAGIPTDESVEESLCRLMVLHTSRLDAYEKLRLEVNEIARAKIMATNLVLTEVDVLSFKVKAKESTRISARRAKRTRREVLKASLWIPTMWNDTTAARRTARSPIVCSTRQTLIEKMTWRNRFTNMLLGILNGRFMRDIQKDIHSWESDIRSSWDLSAVPMWNKHYLEGNMLDSGAEIGFIMRFTSQSVVCIQAGVSSSMQLKDHRWDTTVLRMCSTWRETER